MKTAKSAMLGNSILAGLFLLVALAVYVTFYHIYPLSFVQEQPLELRATIQNAKDIEKLRTLALSMDGYEHSRVKLLGVSVKFIITLCISAGIFFIFNILNWLKLLREQNNEPLSWWLRWL